MYQSLQKVVASILCMVSSGLLLSNAYADGTSSPQMQEAAIFFSKLAQDTSNPFIANLAKESLNRLEHGNASSKREVTVSLVSQNNSSLAVPVMLNRKSMGTFLIDTGATYTVITPRLAQKLNITVTPDMPKIAIVTANGVVKAPVVTINSVMIGEVEVRNVKAIVQPLGDDMLLAGLLGMNFFQGMDLAVKSDKLILSVNVP